jgi:hypothetical protein
MVVTSQCSGHRVTGLYVGADNVRRYFPRRIQQIELQLDHLRIECGLRPHFWDGEPEIRDPRLCLWLESKQAQRTESWAPMPLDMTPSGEHSFTLGPHKADILTPGKPETQPRPRRTTRDTALPVPLRAEPALVA